MIPPKPRTRPDRVSLLQYLRLFRRDILSAQPARLYRAWMAEFRTPFFRSYLCNDPALVGLVLKARPDDFPKSNRVREGLSPLLGQSVFLTNGEAWQRQRRIIDPAFEGGKVKEAFPAMRAAALSARDRIARQAGKALEIESEASHGAADVIFRILFSIPIENEIAARVFSQFRNHQRSQPLLNLAAFVPLPGWFPRFHRRAARRTAMEIRTLIARLVDERMKDIHAGTAPADLATKIMTTVDPATGTGFDADEMIDQVAIFFLAGHETSASALAWALYLLAADQEAQEKVAREVNGIKDNLEFSDISRLEFTRNVFREALRLYPPVPMMVRENRHPETFRARDVRRGSQIVVSPWHIHRHERIWDNPDAFDPDRWRAPEARQSVRQGFLPFSAGPRVCPGAGIAMIEGVLFLALLVRDLRFSPAGGQDPVPVAHLTVRAKDGIMLAVHRRGEGGR
ncbi:MAG: cytochrome P450 [Rhodobacteraceae bacterium]|nr:cytochrome P450 [Paracoccaceae bacterium]MCP5340664.1 cytochrome P450 [Paracoccaceae bacterium]